MDNDYVSRDRYGMYADQKPGPGPALMGADTLLGNDVYNSAAEDLGDIKEIMIDMSSGHRRLRGAAVPRRPRNGRQAVRGPMAGPEPGHRRQALHARHCEGDAEGRSRLRQGPLPSMADATWVAGVHKFYGTTYRER
ncbi:MAG: PRC-barrel domain-containing protein [Pseudomonadota bacterium]